MLSEALSKWAKFKATRSWDCGPKSFKEIIYVFNIFIAEFLRAACNANTGLVCVLDARKCLAINGSFSQYEREQEVPACVQLPLFIHVGFLPQKQQQQQHGCDQSNLEGPCCFSSILALIKRLCLPLKGLMAAQRI